MGALEFGRLVLLVHVTYLVNLELHEDNLTTAAMNVTLQQTTWSARVWRSRVQPSDIE